MLSRFIRHTHTHTHTLTYTLLTHTHYSHNFLFNMSACFLAYLSFFNFIMSCSKPHTPYPEDGNLSPTVRSAAIKLFVALPISAIAFEEIAFTKTNKIFPSFFRFYFIFLNFALHMIS